MIWRRYIIDRIFSVTAALSVTLLVIVLFLILVPVVRKGFGAVVFRGTVEFRHMQFAEFGRGNEQLLNAEIAEAERARKHVYEIIEKFKNSQFKSQSDPSDLVSKARKIHREFSGELRYKNTPRQEYTTLRDLSKQIRNELLAALRETDKAKIKEHLEQVFEFKADERLTGTAAMQYFEMASEFLNTALKTNFQKRKQYQESLTHVEEILYRSTQKPGLLGPHPDETLPALAMFRYGATRWDSARKLLHRLLWQEKWVEQQTGKHLVKIEVSRAELFAGTELEPLFSYLQENLEKMLKPRWTFYWQYFIDDSTPGHYFGGVGPEIFGTLMLTLLSMIFAIPLGIISAAYLAECTREGIIIRVIRMCINTLAGVPSIVFGLFGLAFFVLYFIPLFGGPSKPCILAGSLTLALLTLPVMIRASEEAIRTVPQSYKEASLALGAGHFRTFMTVTLPAALPGILTGVILSLSRVAGETAPILFTAGVAVGPAPTSVFHTTRTLSYGIWDMAVADNISLLVPHNQYGMVITLVLLVLCLNTSAIILRARVFKKPKGR